MTSKAEAQFRDVERQLDDALRKDQEAIVAGGVDVFDESQRRYHYKNEYLSWAIRFESRWQHGSEIEKVWGSLSVQEDDPTVAKVWRRAEIFQIGQSPRWQKTEERIVPLASLLGIGLAKIVAEEIEDGRKAATNAG